MTYTDLNKPKVPTQAPKWLDKYGKLLWPKVASFLNKNAKILRADEYLLQQYCSTYDIYRKAYESIKVDGLQQKIFKTTISPTTGEIVAQEFAGFRKNPAVQTMTDSLNKLNSIGRELGLSPKARSEMLALGAPDNDKKTTAESLKEFFKAKK